MTSYLRLHQTRSLTARICFETLTQLSRKIVYMYINGEYVQRNQNRHVLSVQTFLIIRRTTVKILISCQLNTCTHAFSMTNKTKGGLLAATELGLYFLLCFPDH